MRDAFELKNGRDVCFGSSAESVVVVVVEAKYTWAMFSVEIPICLGNMVPEGKQARVSVNQYLRRYLVPSTPIALSSTMW
jgi:hypothetical protein